VKVAEQGILVNPDLVRTN